MFPNNFPYQIKLYLHASMYQDLWIWPSISTIIDCIISKTIHCIGCAYSEEWVIILWWFGRRVMWPTVTQPMSMSCPSTTSRIFSLTNLQEEVRIGMTILSREYPIKCNSNLFIHWSIIENSFFKISITRWIQLKITTFCHYLFISFQKNQYKNTNTDYI